MMKTLSLWQPWASFIIAGLKEYETRSWSTSHRGKLAIHAAKKQSVELHEYLFDLQNKFPGDFDQFEYKELPFGCVLAVCNLKHVYRTEDCAPYLSERELVVGNFSPERFAWELEVIEVFDPPIPAAGKQGLWEWDERVSHD